MRSLKFHRVRAENVLCFGPKGVEIHFSDYGNVVQVVGINHDMPGTDQNPASNGTGKSSIQEILSIGLFGKTVKKPTKNKGGQIINCLAEKGEVEVQWDDYRLVRTFKRSKTGSITSKVQLWKSPHKVWDAQSYVDRGTLEMQAEIEESIGLSHHAFCNVVIFDDSNTYSFLEADTPMKRQIVENLLDLDQYREYHQNAKDSLKDLKKKIEIQSKEYGHLADDVLACDRRIATVRQQEVQWKSVKQREYAELDARIKKKQTTLESTDTGEQLANWQKAQERIAKLTDEITDFESKRTKVEEALVSARLKVENARTERANVNEGIQTHHLALKEATAELDKTLRLMGNLENLKEGSACPVCHGTINRDNYGHVLEHSRTHADQCRSVIGEKTAVISEERERFGKKSATISMMEEKIGEAEAKVAVFDGKIRKSRGEIVELSKLGKPEGNATERVLEAEIVELKKQLKSKKEEYEGESPYKEIVEQAVAEKLQKETDRDAKAKELQEVEAEAPYYEYWLEAFGDNGIRKFVIEGMIPALNDRISHWLECLIDGMIEVQFDNKFEETIVRNGNPASYHNMSNGECRRINLATSQSFAYVMMLDSGSCPSVVFLDEITGGGIDRAGVYGVYNMILELAKERQVFVTTHNETLMSLLQGCDTITLKKQNDITVLVS